MKKIVTLLLVSLCTKAIVFGQHKQTGPIISDFGAVATVENTNFKTDTEKTYKVVFDIMNSPKQHDALNKSIETAARFLNMHAQSGVPKSQLHVALVVHNAASKDLMDSASYLKTYGVANPNEELIKSLLKANVKVVFCGQSSVSRNIPKNKLIPGVQLALSAMTALTILQDDNYRLIKF